MSARGLRLVAALVLAVALACAATAWAVPPGELVSRAQRAEDEGDMPAATRALEELLAAGVDSDGVLYDLGTAWAHSERYGEAIWCFERVLLRSPGNLSARNNLRATRVRLARRDAGRSGRAVVETQEPLSAQIGELLPYGVSVPLATGAELLVIALWFARRRAKSELARVGTTAGLALALLATAASLGLVVMRGQRPPSAIVLHGGLRLRQTPRVDGIPDAAVREGERVVVARRAGEFTRVKTLGGAEGWLSSRELGALRE